MTHKPLPEYSPEAQSLHVGGQYEHYKGLPYKVIAIARHSETLEELVVYQQLYGKMDIWVRPLSMFIENVSFNGQIIPRFKKL